MSPQFFKIGNRRLPRSSRNTSETSRSKNGRRSRKQRGLATRRMSKETSPANKSAETRRPRTKAASGLTRLRVAAWAERALDYKLKKEK